MSTAPSGRRREEYGARPINPYTLEVPMKRALLTVAATLLLVTPTMAQIKPCDELKSEIEEKIKKNGVKTFTLEIVPKGEAAKAEAPKEGEAKKEAAAGEGKVVGSCEGGTKQILYKK
jgi:hypothetical protein